MSTSLFSRILHVAYPAFIALVVAGLAWTSSVQGDLALSIPNRHPPGIPLITTLMPVDALCSDRKGARAGKPDACSLEAESRVASRLAGGLP